MTGAWRLATRIWHLFVDDTPVAAALLGWIAITCLALPRLQIGPWSGPVLFAGIALVTFVSLKPR